MRSKLRNGLSPLCSTEDTSSNSQNRCTSIIGATATCVSNVRNPLRNARLCTQTDPRTGEVLVPEYCAEVGRLTRNVVVQGDKTFSMRQQFGAQIIFASSQKYDNSIIARLSNIEVRQAGQGLKLGKYPIHFHLVGKVDKSYVTNCSVHQCVAFRLT